MAERKQTALRIDAVSAGTAQFSVSLSADDAETLCSNLIMNALQHTPEGGHVTARIEVEGQALTLRVTDDGEGIPESALPHVFERFYRADRSRARSSGGAGLGLSICKAIVERADGSIRIESTPGKGAEVTVTLPAIPDELQTRGALETAQPVSL